jgi:cation-transporting ATPase E
LIKKKEVKKIYADLPRLKPDISSGLTSEEVRLRRAAGACNIQPDNLTKSVGAIVWSNILTPFNLINFLIAAAILTVAVNLRSWEVAKNALFFGIAVCSAAMGIFQELRSKKALDKLAILSKAKIKVIRDGKQMEIHQEELVLDDIVLLSTGNQVCADSVALSPEGLEVDESLLTGEADRVPKKEGDKVLSGSFITAGRAYARVLSVGADNYATSLTVAAKKEKKPQTPLMRTLNTIIRALTLAIFPLGALLFYMQFTQSRDLDASVLGSAAAMLGMIPEGLVLLTGVTLTVGALKLSQNKALVQSLPSIETLARTDVLCLDKTGTITDGALSFEELIPCGAFSQDECAQALAELLAAVHDTNATASALRRVFSSRDISWKATEKLPFSSARKLSAVSFDGRGSVVLGAPKYIFPEGGQDCLKAAGERAAMGQRVLCLAKSGGAISKDGELPGDWLPMALVLLSDTVRREAAGTFKFFKDEGLTLKVISGDDPLTVSAAAKKAEIEGSQNYIDMSEYGETDDFSKIVEEFTVFGRVSPVQKRGLILALKQNGHTACMTGDGVNDVLAMKEADCSVAMINGSDAARGASDFVLMSSDFSSMIKVLREGRRVINNIETVASMYLVKTIYSALLSLIYAFLPFQYPFSPIQMTPINILIVGVPSFLFALRGNYEKPRGKFIPNVLENAIPAALTVVFNILAVQCVSLAFALPEIQTSTMNVLLTGAVGVVLLTRVGRPVTKLIKYTIIALAAAFVLVFILFRQFFSLDMIISRNVFFYGPLIYVSIRIFAFLEKTARALEDRLLERNNQKKKSKKYKIVH